VGKYGNRTLKKTYNVIYVGKEDRNDAEKYENFYKLAIKSEFNEAGKGKLKRKAELDNHTEHNKNQLWDEFQKAFGDLKIDYTFFAHSTYYELPLTSYFSGKDKRLMNEFHDYVGNDEQEILRLNEMSRHVANNIDKRVSILAYTMFHKNIFVNLSLWISKNKNLKLNYVPVLDPVVFTKFFDYNNIPTKTMYFVDDKRGTRNLQGFHFDKLQHLIYESKHVNNRFDINNMEPEKSHEFFWMGSIFHQRGDRKNMWDLFLNDLDLDKNKNSIWAPIRANGVFENKSKETTKHGKRAIARASEYFPELVNRVLEHPLFANHLIPNQVKNNIYKYKYTFIMRCVSLQNSLNFRPVYYTYLRILPFIDELYDPDYLQIPKDIQDKLVVKNSSDIQERIKYFNENPEERLELLNKLHAHFAIDNFLANWETDTSNYFKTI